MKAKTLLLLVIALVLASCGRGTTAAGTPVGVATAAATGSEGLPTRTLTPSPEATQAPSAAAPEPTAAVAPSATLSPSLQPTLTPAVLPTRTPSPTGAVPVPPPTSPANPTAAASWWEVSSFLVGPGDPSRLYALQRKLVGGNTVDPGAVRLLVSDDGGQTWSPFRGELPAKECLRNVDMDYAEVDALYASTCRGLYRWSGSAWDLVSQQPTNLVAVVYGQPQVLWAAQPIEEGPVVIRSDDGGVTWTPAATGLTTFRGVDTLGIDPTDPNRLFAIILPDYAGSYLRRGNSSGLWETMPTPNSNTVIDTGMAIDGPTGDLYVITWVPTYQLWRSQNPGAELADVEWELLHDFGPDLRASLLAAGPGPDGLTLYANLTPVHQLEGGMLEIGPAVLQRSLDMGQTWSAIPIPTGDDVSGQ